MSRILVIRLGAWGLMTPSFVKSVNAPASKTEALGISVVEPLPDERLAGYAASDDEAFSFRVKVPSLSFKGCFWSRKLNFMLKSVLNANFGHNLFNVLRDVVLCVSCSCVKLKIFSSIVELVTVNVVNYLSLAKRYSVSFLKNNAMLRTLLFIFVHKFVAITNRSRTVWALHDFFPFQKGGFFPCVC